MVKRYIVWQDPKLDGTPSSRGKATGEASWTLVQLKSQLLETASWTLAQLRSSSHLEGILAVEGRALPSLPALERGVPIGLSLLQTASSQDRDLGSDPLGLTSPRPRAWRAWGFPLQSSMPKPVPLGQASKPTLMKTKLDPQP